MDTRETAASAAAAVGVLILLGCSREYLFGGGHPEQTTAPHPATNGITTIPPLVTRSPEIEQQRGLPADTLVQQATMVSGEGGTLCFDVDLRGIGRAYVDLSSWTVSLRAAKGSRIESYEAPAGQRPREITSEVHDGQVPQQVQTGTETICAKKDPNGQCVRWSERPVMETEWIPGPVEVARGGGTICFPVGQLGETHKVALRLNAKNRVPIDPYARQQPSPTEAPGPSRLTFQWNFTP